MSSGGSPVSGPRRVTSRRKSQVALAVVAAVLVVVFSFGGFVAGLLTDSWWFRDLGHHSVWTTRIVTTAVLFAIGVVVTGLLGTLIAVTVARSTPVNPPDQSAARLRMLFGGRPRSLRIAGVGALVLLMAPALAGNTSTVLLLINGDAGVGPKDPLFGRPLGFYFFVLPFLRARTGWLLALLAVSILAALVAAYLVGAWRPGRRGGELPPGLRRLVGALSAAWFILRGVAYLFDRWSLVTSGRGYVDGPGATDLRTRLSGLAVLAGIAFVVAVIIVIGTVRRDVVPSIVGGVAWLIVAVVVLQVVPRAYNQIEVRPNSPGIERTPIQRNVNATRAAYGLASIDTQDLNTAPSESAAEAPALAAELTANARIWGPAQRTIAAFNKVVSLDYLRVIDVDMDRYVIDGREQLVAVGALDRVALKSETWSQKHLERTHGYGVMVAPAGEVVGEGEPRIVASGIRKSAISAREPRLYVGEDATSYVVVGTPSEIDVAALDAPAAAANANANAKVTSGKYTGNGGVAIGGFWKKAVFALHFGDRNLLLRSVPSTGKVMYVRDVRARAEKLAPFLRFGADPYPVVLADRVVWVLDGYTVSDHYPYAQRFATGSVLDVRSGLNRGGFNYVRAAVRVVIDAYDGDVRMYRAAGRGTDPLIDAWARTYPSLFAPSSQLEKDRPGLGAHLRYPEDLLRLQSSALGRYHVTTAAAFVDLANDWTPSIAAPVSSGANDPTATAATSSTPAVDERRSEDRAQVDPDDDAQVAAPLYLRHRYPGQSAPTFVLQQSLELRRSTGQRRLLRALVVADTNTDRFGRLRVLLVPAAAEALGPARAFDRMRANPRVSTLETQLGQVGSQVNFGDVQVLATTAGLVYQRPMFLKPESSDLQELKYVLVLAGNRVTIEPSVAAAFEKALTGSTGSPTVPSPPTPSTPGETPTETPVDANATVGELLDDAAASLAAAEAALKDGDLGLYQQRVEDARRQIEAARDASKPKTS